MDASQFVFSGNGLSNGNAAVAALMVQLKTAKDSASTPLWKFIGRGIGIPGYGDSPQLVALDVRDDQSPAILIYDATDQHISTATQWEDSTTALRLSLYCYVNVLGSDFGNYPDIQVLRRNMTKATLKVLRPYDSVTNPLGWPDPSLVSGQFPYWLEEPQVMNVDYDDDLRNKFQDFSIRPPWWMWRIDLAFRTTNV